MRTSICKWASAVILAVMTTAAYAESSDGHFWLQLRDKNIQMDDATNHFAEWLNLPADATFQLLKDETDELGIRHLRYRQYVAGVEVQASMVMVHGRDGLVTSANGVVMEQAEQPKTIRRAPTRGSGQQTPYLVKSPRGYRYAYLQYDFVTDADVYVDAETGKVLKSLPRKHTVKDTMQGRTLYSGTVPLTVSTLTDGRHLLTDSTRRIYTLNALNATDENMADYIIGKNEKGQDIYDRERYLHDMCTPFQTNDDFWKMLQVARVTLDTVEQQSDPFAEVYMMVRNKRGDTLVVSPSVYSSSLPATLSLNTKGGKSAFCNIDSFYVETWLYQYTADDVLLDRVGFSPLAVGQSIWNSGHTAGHIDVEVVGNPVVDIHWGMAQTYDWYKSVVGRDSYDGKGAPIYNIFLAPKYDLFIGMGKNGGNNAFANFDPRFNCWVMEYDIGDGIKMSPVVTLDVLAHEFTHLVTESTAKLEYQGESGALNESFSDIMGISVKHAVKGSKAADNWLIGEEVMLQDPCMRDMSHRLPAETKQPVYYKGEDWIPTDSPKDDGGVHTNSGVQNYWFYVLCEGAQGGKFDNMMGPWGEGVVVNGIGMEKAVQIAYRNLTQYLSERSNYADARRGSLQAAADLYGEFSQEYESVDNAWYAVGVTGGDTPSTAIRALKKDNDAPVRNQWYSLQGQRIDTPTWQGIYIRNGKKIIIK